jgi:hypothetical protein
MKNKTVFIGALSALGLWLLSAEVGQCFYSPESHGRGGGASPVSLANPAVSIVGVRPYIFDQVLTF